jgi:uncharacterized protein (TIGR02118 family)
MYKLVILIQPLEDWEAFEAEWPRFLHMIERLPGLQREAISRVENFLYGDSAVTQMHELFFDTYAQAESAMASSQGQAAGRLLQEMTGGRMALFISEHKEDTIENLRKYQEEDAELG